MYLSSFICCNMSNSHPFRGQDWKLNKPVCSNLLIPIFHSLIFLPFSVINDSCLEDEDNESDDSEDIHGTKLGESLQPASCLKTLNFFQKTRRWHWIHWQSQSGFWGSSSECWFNHRTWWWWQYLPEKRFSHWSTLKGWIVWWYGERVYGDKV